MLGKRKKYVVTESMNGLRIDQAIAMMEKDVSRQYIQKLIKEGKVFLAHKQVKPSFLVNEKMEILVDYPSPVKMEIEPVHMPLDVVFEDEYILVVNKEAGVVVHPAEQGKFMGKSLVNAALAHVGDGLKGIGGVLRPGIVHRLDKDTSGLIIIAKTDMAHQNMVELFKSRNVKKNYMALLKGALPVDHGFIEEPIGRDSRNRKLMSVHRINAKDAKTEFWKIATYKYKTQTYVLVNVGLHTGRTHQIRVHFSSIGHPLVGDSQYGDPGLNKLFRDSFGLKRQFLHAYNLKFEHPINKKTVDLEIGLPSELQGVLDALETSIELSAD